MTHPWISFSSCELLMRGVRGVAPAARVLSTIEVQAILAAKLGVQIDGYTILGA